MQVQVNYSAGRYFGSPEEASQKLPFDAGFEVPIPPPTLTIPYFLYLFVLFTLIVLSVLLLYF